MDRNRARYIRALKYDCLTILYDPLLRVILKESLFKRQLIEQAHIQKGQNILDLGCGTATLTLLAKKMHPETQVVGIDADPKVLEIGRAKIRRAGTYVGLDLGMSVKLPFPDRYFTEYFPAYSSTISP